MKKNRLILCIWLGLALFSCQKEELLSPAEQITQIELELSGLRSLGNDYWYEAWLVWKEGETEKNQSIGIFSIDDQGHLTPNQFEVALGYLQQTIAFIVTIEEDDVPGKRFRLNNQSQIDTLLGPSSNKIFAAKLVTNKAYFSIGDEFLLNYDFATAQGNYLLATPSSESTSIKTSGLWFVDKDSADKIIAGLNLPELGAGWSYEGWIRINGTEVSTGKFMNSAVADDTVRYYDPGTKGYPFPGEDFLINAPGGLNFPIDLSGAEVFITIEPPHPPDCAAPYLLKVLSAMIPSNAESGVVYAMDNGVTTFPTGQIQIRTKIFK